MPILKFFKYTQKLFSQSRERRHLADTLFSREVVVAKSDRISWETKGRYVYSQVLLAEYALQKSAQICSDAYICLLPSLLPAGFALKDVNGGMVLCDVVENVDVTKHTVAPNQGLPVVRMANHAAVGALYEADKLLTVSNALGKTLERYGRPLLVLPNRQPYREYKPDPCLRQAFGIPHQAKVAVISGSVVEGFEQVLYAFSQLPDDLHLLGLARFPVAKMREHFDNLVAVLGLQHRVHIQGFVPQDRLHSILSACDMGLITNSIDNPNAAVGLPNRFFDFLSAGLPIVSTAMPDVKVLIDEYEIGRVVKQNTAENWRVSLEYSLKNSDMLSRNVCKAKRALSWENIEDEFLDFMGDVKSVTFISRRNLQIYERHKRLARSLVKRGVKVRFFYTAPLEPDSSLQDDIDHVVVTNLYTPPSNLQNQAGS